MQCIAQSVWMHTRIEDRIEVVIFKAEPYFNSKTGMPILWVAASCGSVHVQRTDNIVPDVVFEVIGQTVKGFLQFIYALPYVSAD